MNNILYIIKRNTSPENYESLMEGFSNFKRIESSQVKETSAILALALRQKNDNPQKTDLRNIPKGIIENLATFTPETPSLTEDERNKASREGFNYETKLAKHRQQKICRPYHLQAHPLHLLRKNKIKNKSSDGMDTQEDEKSAGNQTGEPMDVDTPSNNSNKRARDNTSEDDKGNPNPAPKKVKIDGGPNTQEQER